MQVSIGRVSTVLGEAGHTHPVDESFSGKVLPLELILVGTIPDITVRSGIMTE